MAANQEPCSAQWALDLLEPSPYDQSNHFSRYYMVPLAAFLGVKSTHVYNRFRGLPKYTNVPRIIISGTVSALFGYCLHLVINIKNARHDAVLRDYIRLHPERFPPPENRKFADIFKPWRPVR